MPVDGISADCVSVYSECLYVNGGWYYSGRGCNLVDVVGSKY